MNRIKVAIIGSGNIGMDLLYKIRLSRVLECSYFIGRRDDSPNIMKAKEMGYKTSSDSIQTIIDNPECCEIVFDATTAESHKSYSSILKKMGKYVIDLTPSLVGKLCVPCLNSKECLEFKNVNMITCGGQAVVPIAYAIKQACPETDYLEVVSTIASNSAGPGTRANIDEYIETTKMALSQFTNVKNTKAMIVLNPAEPPVSMRNTIYAKCNNIDMQAVTQSVNRMVKHLEKYIPGYQMLVEPTLFNENIVTVTVQVEGSGDFLPSYAGNLDIITCAAVEIGECYARQLICQEEACPFWEN